MEDKKKIGKIFVIVFSVLLCLSISLGVAIWLTVGAGHKQETVPGEIIPITFEEVQDKIEEKETFFSPFISPTSFFHSQTHN